MYQLQTRLSDILIYPLPERIRQLSMIVDSVPIKDLAAFFPSLVNSIFGNDSNSGGWGLRLISAEKTYEFRLLYDFMSPHSAFFQIIYRILLLDAVKYEIKLSELPVKLRQLLESGRNSSFYSNLLNIDNFQTRNLSLSLNAFDFFIFHFALHGVKNLHKTLPAALMVNNENLKTVYFNLAADYFCNFLPSDPNAVIYPQIDCFSSPTSKSHSSSPLPIQNNNLRPPKYLLLSALSHQTQNPTNTTNPVRLPDNARSANWRSESVLNIFIDCWLRYDVDEWELPGNEFIRMVRILVKQLHFFGNSAEQDLSSLRILRAQAQPMLNARIYPFLKTVISRWPLDSSFLNPLECFLSYIQPWRYVANRNVANLNNELQEIPDRFKLFIAENLQCYTQVFVRLIQRGLKMDLSLPKNALMMFRLIKVYRQPCEILKEIEKQMNSSSGAIRSNNSSFNDNSSIHSSPRNQNSFNRSPHPNRSHNHSGIDDSNYIFMFSEEVTSQIYELMQRFYLAKLKTTQEVEKVEMELQKHTTMWEKFLQLVGWFSSLSLSFSMALEEKKKTPIYLDFCLNVLSPVFNISIEDATREFDEQQRELMEDSDEEHLKMKSGSEFLNITPSFMKQQLLNVSYSGDPFLYPIMDHEVKFLVRFLHQISVKLNEMFENEFEFLWYRQDFTGKLTRQILSAPVETKTFDKSAGYSELKVKQFGPRLSLRKFASRKVILMIGFVLLFGRLFFGASSLGFITFAIIALGYLVLKAIFSS